MQDQTAQVDDLRLVALPSAVNCAELFVRFTLTEWHVPQIIDDVRETAKRMVLAVIATVVEGADPTMITVRLRLRGATVVVEVQDDRSSPRLVVPRSLANKRSGIETLSRGRQLIWCELPLPTGMDAIHAMQRQMMEMQRQLAQMATGTYTPSTEKPKDS